MRLKTKLLLGFSMVIVLMGFAFLFVMSMLERQNEAAGAMVKKQYENVRMAMQIRDSTNSIALTLREMMLHPQQNNVEELLSMHNARQISLEAMDQLERENQGSKIGEITNKIRVLRKKYIDIESRTRNMMQEGNTASADLLQQQGVPIRLQMNEAIEELCSLEEGALQAKLREMENSEQNARRLVFGLFLTAILLSAAVIVWLIRGLERGVSSLTNVMNSSIDDESILHMPRIANIANDEIGDIGKVYNLLSAKLEDRAKKAKEYQAILAEQNWLQSALAEIAMRNQGINTLEELGTTVISMLAKFANAGYAIMYIHRFTKEQEEFVRLASYAQENREYGQETVRVGERLVGQCAVERRPILLMDIPDAYLTIGTGLGEAKPACIYLVPAVFKDQVAAVIEMASFTTFSAVQQDLLERAAQNIAVTINRIENRLQVEQLLRESQTLTEELQTQSEELQMQQEELRNMNDQLEVQYQSSEEKNRQIEVVKTALEEKARQVELSSRYKSEFLANMSHELRTPLNSMLLLSQMLKENAAGNLTEQQVSFAKTIYTSGTDLLNLINDVLDLSKIESGNMTIACSEASSRALVETLQRTFQVVAEQKGLIFRITIDPSVPLLFYTDELRLQQILNNLLSNAFKFTEQGEVDCSIVREKTDEHDQLVFTVRDTGIGIPKEQQHVVFEAFRQVDGTNSRKYSGTGLGLSISQKLAKLLGGRIDLESEAGAGSVFTLRIPYLQPEMGQLVETEAAAASEQDSQEIISAETFEPAEKFDLAGRKILLADDDMRNIYALTAALENLDLDVVFAENGREALSVLEANPEIDLVLMDIMMPEMDGYEAIAQIRRNPKWRDLPIIALTAKAMKHDKEKCLEVGASDYICKPVNLEQLYSLIKVWLCKFE